MYLRGEVRCPHVTRRLREAGGGTGRGQRAWEVKLGEPQLYGGSLGLFKAYGGLLKCSSCLVFLCVCVRAQLLQLSPAL